MSSTMHRWETVCWICDQLAKRPTLGDALISPAPPGDREASTMIVFDELDGDLNIPVATGSQSRHERDDHWSVTVWIMAVGPGGATPDMAMRACGERLHVVQAELENLLADDPGLGEIDTIVDAELTHATQRIGDTGGQFIGVTNLTLSVHSRLT